MNFVFEYLGLKGSQNDQKPLSSEFLLSADNKSMRESPTDTDHLADLPAKLPEQEMPVFE
jgi:hypothetical protein